RPHADLDRRGGRLGHGHGRVVAGAALRVDHAIDAVLQPLGLELDDPALVLGHDLAELVGQPRPVETEGAGVVAVGDRLVFLVGVLGAGPQPREVVVDDYVVAHGGRDRLAGG